MQRFRSAGNGIGVAGKIQGEARVALGRPGAVLGGEKEHSIPNAGEEGGEVGVPRDAAIVFELSGCQEVDANAGRGIGVRRERQDDLRGEVGGVELEGAG